MARLIAALVRHGDYHQLKDTPSAHQPFPLTEKGVNRARVAARGVAQMLSEKGWALAPDVDCSKLLRAWQTAQLFIEELEGLFQKPAQLEPFEALAERGLGSAANLTTAQIREVIEADPRFDALPADWKSNSHYRLPLQGAESLMQAGERVARHINARMDALQPVDGADTVKLFVGHGAAFRHAAHLMGVLEFEQIAALSMYHAQPVYLERLQDGRWRHIAGDWKVRGKGAYSD
ncbi:hypothetical protein ADIMK_3982 [Marinobacterium lacunae]|uniref:Phosphoglycerate mutase family protein n=1 Tax=Marinobacterium lacunae TaxID=1232683 RepID=A0A081FTI0_9GAMM|nr:histidine phosphatase family protein [Marinobacterium lacunae]KEA61835.1 hypothetical protein ADIMK_3982 [Marinobacterium lacunae]